MGFVRLFFKNGPVVTGILQAENFSLLLRFVMGKIYVKEVLCRRTMDDFVHLPRRLYKGNPYYVPDLEQDVRQTFDVRRNAALEFSDIQAFVAYDQGGKPVGRIAAIVNHRANRKWNTKNVRFGFIEFTDDVDVARALLEAAERWGAARGMTDIVGPMGIFDFDKEGMLVEDFDRLGSSITIYNPPYYPRHLEALGYEKEVDWVQTSIEIPDEVPARYARTAVLAQEMYGLHVRKLTLKEIRQGYGRKVFRLLNEAYAPLYGYTELMDHQIDEYLKRYLPVLDLRLIPVVENAEGELVGVAITMCSLSRALQQSGGRLWPLGWLYLLRALRWKRSDKADLYLVAVRPDYQGLGVNALFFTDLISVYHELGIRYAETGPQLEENVKELGQWASLHPAIGKRRRCYKKKIVSL